MGMLMRMAIHAVIGHTLLAAAPSQAQLRDEAQDAMARAMAIGIVLEALPSHRWPSDTFPLTIGYFFGPFAEASKCLPVWRRQLSDYVRWMNAGKRPLLRLSASPDAAFDAFDAVIYDGGTYKGTSNNGVESRPVRISSLPR